MRVAVIGGGVIGLCSAYSLAREGCQVVVIDPGDGPRTSTVNAGMIVPSHVIPLAAPGMVGVGLKMMLRPKSPFWIRPRLSGELLRWSYLFARSCTPKNVEKSKRLLAQLNTASKALYLDFAHDLDGFQVFQRGLLMIAATEHSLAEETGVAQQVRELGLPAAVLGPSDLKELEPGIEIEAVGGVHYPADCHFSPNRFMDALQQRLCDLGVAFVQGRAFGFDIKRERIVSIETESRRIEADEFVLAGGAWSGALGRRLGIDLPMQAGKGYSFNVEKPPQMPTVPSILMEDRVAVTPMVGGVRFGGTMEIGPADSRIDMGRVDGIRQAIPRYYPALKGCDLSSPPVGIGLRPCTPDGLPFIGRPKAVGNLTVATGHAMMGMSLGPITGKLVAEIVLVSTASIAIEALSPDRFRKP